MGAEVTLIEVLDRILPVEDAEISAFVRKSFEKQGMKILTAAKVQGVRKEGDGLTAVVEAGGKVQEIKADRLISAVGIVGNVEDIGLEGHRREGRPHPCRDRRVVPHRRARRLRHRRPHRRALARAQGEPRGGHLRREDRRRERRPSARRAEHPRLHLLPPAGRLRRPDRGGREGGRPRAEGRPLPLHRQRQGHRHGRAGGHGEDGVRRQDRASCSAPTWPAPR